MAKVLFGNGVSAIRGSIAGNTYSVNANGAYIRNRGIVSNSNTQKQATFRTLFASIAATWRLLTVPQANSFIEQASSGGYDYIDNMGQSRQYTGMQLYMKSNMQLASIGAPLLTSMIPPVAIPPYEFDTPSQAALDAFTVSINAIPSPVVPANFNLVLYATTQFSGGKYRPKEKDFKSLVVYPAAEATDNLDEQTTWEAVFGNAIGGNYTFLAVKLVSLKTGQQGNPVWVKAAIN